MSDEKTDVIPFVYNAIRPCTCEPDPVTEHDPTEDVGLKLWPAEFIAQIRMIGFWAESQQDVDATIAEFVLRVTETINVFKVRGLLADWVRCQEIVIRQSYHGPYKVIGVRIIDRFDCPVITITFDRR